MAKEATTNNPDDATKPGQADTGTGGAPDEGSKGTPALTQEQVNELLKDTSFKTVKEAVKGYKELQGKATKDSLRLKDLQRQKDAEEQQRIQQEALQKQITEKEELKSFNDAFSKGPDEAFKWLKVHDENVMNSIVNKMVKPLQVRQRVTEAKVTYGEEVIKHEREIAEIIQEYGLAATQDPIKAALKIMRGDRYGGSESEARQRIAREIKLEQEKRKATMAPETGGKPGEVDEDEKDFQAMVGVKKPMPF